MKTYNITNNNPNFNGFIRFSNIELLSKEKIQKLNNFVLNTDEIKTIRPLNNKPRPLGAIIETANSGNYKIPETSLQGTENKFDTILSHIVEAHKNGYNNLNIYI